MGKKIKDLRSTLKASTYMSLRRHAGSFEYLKPLRLCINCCRVYCIADTETLKINKNRHVLLAPEHDRR